MTLIDWTVVIVLNGSVIAYALWRGKDTGSSSDWFLAGRTLPWWIIGLSLYATAIDSTDLVVDSGAAYDLGMRHFVINWVGLVGGWVLLANWIAPPMYRAGMFTNAEYLEARFGISARVISVLVQVLYRTVIIGMIATTNYLTLMIVCEWSSVMAWTIVVAVALLATIYTMVGGLKSVAITDAMQSIIMFVAGAILFSVLWNHVGGWTGIQEGIGSHDEKMADRILNIGSEYVHRKGVEDLSPEQLERKLLLGGQYDEQQLAVIYRTPAWLISLTLIIVGFAFATVNHTQSMRLFGARSMWHLKMSVVPACLILLFVTFVNFMMGIMGKSIYPDITLLPVEPALQKIDAIYAILIRDFTTAGLKGVVVAGLFAASFSTYDSIGSALSALVTRDIYGRLIVTSRDDTHYLTVARWLTPIIVFGSFIYIPALLSEGMIFIYLDVVGAFVVPLFGVYLMGIFTSVHHRSATVGLLVGGSYGLLTLIGPWLGEHYGVMVLPAVLFDRFVTAPTSLLLTTGTMFITTLILGWESRRDLCHEEKSTWLRQSQQQVVQAVDTDAASNSRMPLLCGLGILCLGLVLSFVVFW